MLGMDSSHVSYASMILIYAFSATCSPRRHLSLAALELLQSVWSSLGPQARLSLRLSAGIQIL